MTLLDVRLFLTMRAKAALAFFGFGYEAVPLALWGVSPWRDVKRAVRIAGARDHWRDPIEVIFDVGANDGRTSRAFSRHFPSAEIYAFEPSAEVFPRLDQVARECRRVHAFQIGIGSRNERRPFFEQAHSPASSFAPWTPVASEADAIRTTELPLIPLDDFCRDQGIAKIDLLKIDTEGFELEALRGAQRMLELGRIRFVYFEFLTSTPSDGREGLEGFTEPAHFLTAHSFRPMAFYTEFVDTLGTASGYNVLMMRTRPPIWDAL